MELIKISHLTKTYKVGSTSVDVLKDISFTLPQSGLVVILGKSGSGKSTLLNIIGGIDKPSKGVVKCSFLKNVRLGIDVSFIFQHYYLLENETPLYNIMLPALIQGFQKGLAEKQARELIRLFHLDESIIEKQTKLLSGGEKERIAILRALITDPKVILADEPTGALDSQNAIKTMSILKKASKKKLVLLVTHNSSLAREYADRIITLSDGKIISDEKISTNDEEVFYSKVKHRHRNDWTSTLVNHNFRKRLKRNFVSILGMTISLTFCYLLFGFSNQSNNAIQDISMKHFDYGTSVLRKELKTESDSPVSLIKTMKPNEEEIDDMETKFPSFKIMPNYDQILGTSRLYLNNDETEEINKSYVLNYSSSVNNNLVIQGTISDAFSWNDVVVNKRAFEMIDNRMLHFKIIYERTYNLADSSTLVDILEIEQQLNIIAVVDELEFLMTPKIYFNYSKVDELFAEIELENYSDYKNKTYTWKDMVEQASDSEDISSYSMRCFLKNINEKDKVLELSNYLQNDVRLENDSLSVKEALESLTLAASVGLEIFLVIALMGSILIVGVFSYSAYCDDKKESSILSCLGAKNSAIIGIFTTESLIVTFFSFLFSTVFSALLQKPVNLLLLKTINIPNLIEIPFKNLYGIKGLLPLAVFVISMMLTMLFSSIPIFINKKISIKKELSDL